MTLPKEFWTKNEFDVMGGVENAFMSTTTNREVALGYASGGTVGIVFEIAQGMVDRGADISWLSQYPHEAEILFVRGQPRRPRTPCLMGFRSPHCCRCRLSWSEE